jgi:hypothetical protein
MIISHETVGGLPIYMFDDLGFVLSFGLPVLACWPKAAIVARRHASSSSFALSSPSSASSTLRPLTEDVIGGSCLDDLSDNVSRRKSEDAQKSAFRAKFICR